MDMTTLTPRQREIQHHLTLFDDKLATSLDQETKEVKYTPIFSNRVRDAVEAQTNNSSPWNQQETFPQYGLLGRSEAHSFENNASSEAGVGDPDPDNLVYTNMNAPWSAFICGSQGGGKSHTLSCLLENSLLASSATGKLPNPLAGIVFHYDKFTSHATSQLCEVSSIDFNSNSA